MLIADSSVFSRIKDNLTPQELEVLELTAILFAAFVALPVIHPSDVTETQRDIHDIQNRILARASFGRPGYRQQEQPCQ